MIGFLRLDVPGFGNTLGIIVAATAIERGGKKGGERCVCA